MGADNWAICPKCKAKAIEDHDKAIQSVSDAYGKVSEEEYAEMKADLHKTAPENSVGVTLREDYELGIDEDGTFEVSFHAHCTECEFKFSYKHEEKA